MHPAQWVTSIRISLNQQRAKKLKGKVKNEQRSQQDWKSPPQKVMTNHHEHLDSFLPEIFNCMIISLLFFYKENSPYHFLMHAIVI